VSRVVVKCGGAASRDAPQKWILSLADAGDEVCVVHGAGPQISEEMARRGLEVAFVEGRRVTTPAALDVVRESMAEVNAALCTAIGPTAIGLWGDKIGLAASHEPKLGHVGNALPSRPSEVIDALAQGQIPVIVPLAAGPLNVNADEMAVALAEGIEADRVLFITDVAGLLLDGNVVDSITIAEAEALLAEGVLQGGILPKLRAAVAAARFGMSAEIGATRVAADATGGGTGILIDEAKGVGV
jgi:acetylglutamate kinase